MRRRRLGPRPNRALRTGTVTLLGALGMVVALTGCGAGAVSQTARQAPAVNGTAGQVGQILIRDATIAFAGQVRGPAIYQPGQTADLSMTLVNAGTAPDRLVSVSSPTAGAGQVTGEPVLAAGRAVLVGNNAGNDSQALANRTIAVKLVGLTQEIRAGLTYPVTFRFERAGSLTLSLPVGYPSGRLAEREGTVG